MSNDATKVCSVLLNSLYILRNSQTRCGLACNVVVVCAQKQKDVPSMLHNLDCCTETGKGPAARRRMVQNLHHQDSQDQVSPAPAADCFAEVLWALTGGPDLTPPQLGKVQNCRLHHIQRLL